MSGPRDETGRSPQAPQCHQGRSGSKTTENLNRTQFMYANVQPNLGREAYQASEGTHRRYERRKHDETLWGIHRRLYHPTWTGELKWEIRQKCVHMRMVDIC